MFKRINAIKYELKVAALIAQYKNAKTNGEKAIICLKANSLKSDAAHAAFFGKLDIDFYRDLFKVKESNAHNHYLDIWVKEMKEAE